MCIYMNKLYKRIDVSTSFFMCCITKSLFLRLSFEGLCALAADYQRQCYLQRRSPDTYESGRAPLESRERMRKNERGGRERWADGGGGGGGGGSGSDALQKGQPRNCLERGSSTRISPRPFFALPSSSSSLFSLSLSSVFFFCGQISLVLRTTDFLRMPQLSGISPPSLIGFNRKESVIAQDQNKTRAMNI